RRPDHHLSGFILDAVQLARWMDLPIEVVGGFPRWNSGLEVSFKFEDLIMWGMTCAVPADIADSLDQRRDHFLTPDAYEYLSRIHLQAVSFSRQA
ncbi:radical SAM protein, partial [Pseudomonas aeruginosa]|nr:radical SAM protein [Pseudomonas aeruginosa]